MISLKSKIYPTGQPWAAAYTPLISTEIPTKKYEDCTLNKNYDNKDYAH